ncbi:MAG TPA: M35 family metallo-endopeptidase [Anaerolineaceae bacterium]
MSKRNWIYPWFVIFLIVSVMEGVPSVNAATQGSDLLVNISLNQPVFTPYQNIIVQVEISNPTNHPVKVLKWFTPAEDIEESLFTVSRSGQPAAYLGAVYKRPAIKDTDYLTLKPGEKITRSVNLSTLYDFSLSGTYTVRYEVASEHLHAEKGVGVQKTPDQLVSNELKVQVTGKVSAKPTPPPPVPGSNTFNKCTADQQTSLVSARSTAQVYSKDAFAYLNNTLKGTRYTTWFGIFNTARYDSVKTHFDAISNAMTNAGITFDCSCKKPYYAYVYPSQPYKIYLCKVFWSAPLEGSDSKAGTLIHEMSHFYVVASTQDYVYGQTGAKDLAIANPDHAINNADNHEYFAENTPPLD